MAAAICLLLLPGPASSRIRASLSFKRFSHAAAVRMALGPLGADRGLGGGVGGCLRRPGDGSKLLHDLAGDGGRQTGFAAMNAPDGVQHFCLGGVLQQVGLRASADGLEHQLVVVVGGQHHHPRRTGSLAGDLPRGHHAACAGHLQIHHHHIRQFARWPGRPLPGRRQPGRPLRCPARWPASCDRPRRNQRLVVDDEQRIGRAPSVSLAKVMGRPAPVPVQAHRQDWPGCEGAFESHRRVAMAGVRP
jgi:hypothetical protein